MPTLPDLEIALQRRSTDCYSLELRFSDPTNLADQRFASAEPVQINAADLLQRSSSAAAYGQYLGQQLFADSKARSFFDQARAVAQVQELPLRVRLAIGPNAPELHSLRWETLCLPGSLTPLSTDENLVFSRYLSSPDWRPVNLRMEAGLRALLAVASPGDIAEYDLAVIDAEAEVHAVKADLGSLPMGVLATRGQVTLNELVRRMREGYDILYLVAHGMFAKGEPWVFLENEDGTADPVRGHDLAERIRELQERPRLVVLATCQSAGQGADATGQDETALAALGPRLAEAGIPAVIAMHGNVSVHTVERFMPAFFEELQRHGQIDRAVAAARGAVRNEADWWTPVLYMRLKSGRLGYTPGFGDEAGGLRKWPSLLNDIRRGRCTPIIGPNLTEWLLGTRRGIAARWAETYGYPMDPNSRDSLPQVAQYVATEQSEPFMLDQIDEHLQAEVWRRYGEWLPPTIRHAPLDEMIRAVGRLPQAVEWMAPTRILAHLPISIFITTCPTSLLADALRDAGKCPVSELCRWNEQVASLPSVFDEEPDYQPSPERPLIYHLFGHLHERDSLVLTEDDYFDYLIGFTSNSDLVPEAVRVAMTNRALLFVGFDLDDWNFRVLFRSIMSREGRNLLRRYAHVAAQIDPEASRIIEPDGARRYLQTYFGESKISIFWGSPTDFTRELERQWGRP